MKKIIEALEKDLFGHESWVMIGNNQHMSYWWAVIGDAGKWNVDPYDPMKTEKLEYKYRVMAKSFEGVVRKLNKIREKIEMSRDKDETFVAEVRKAAGF